MAESVLINLTGHPVVVEIDNGLVTLSPDGPPARVSESSTVTSAVTTDDGPVPVLAVTPGPVVDLPSSKKDVLLIVSRAVATSATDRQDLVVPYGHLRDEDGHVVACTGLARIGEW